MQTRIRPVALRSDMFYMVVSINGGKYYHFSKKTKIKSKFNMINRILPIVLMC